MNQILTLKDITAIVARETGLDAQQVEAVIKAWIDHTGEELALTGNSVTELLGRFYAEGRGIQFEPATEIAATVNAPFALFEPVEAATGELPQAEMTPKAESIEHAPEAVAEVSVPVEENVTEIEPTEAEPEQEPQPEQKSEPETEALPEPTPQTHEPKVENTASITPTAASSYDIYNIYDDDEPRSGTSPWLYFLWGLVSGLIIACIAVYFLYPPLSSGNQKNIYIQKTVTEEAATPADTTVTVPVDTAAEVVETPETTDSPRMLTTAVTDTVSSTRFLATMAREYYGNMVFWVYIYEENSDILGHPDRIAPGTVVVIPPAAKYNIDPNNQASINSATAIIPRLYEPYR